MRDKKFSIKDRKAGINFPPFHSWCRCSFIIAVDDWDKWIDDYAEKHGKEPGNSVKSVAKSRESGILYSGARITDLFSDEADSFASMFYEEIWHFSTDVQKIAQNLGKTETEIKTIKAYLFEDRSYYNPDTKEWERFAPDCAIAQSWQRLMIGKDIKQHDRTLIKHELYEIEIKRNNPDLSHTEAHTIATKKYNYQKETDEYYDSLKKY